MNSSIKIEIQVRRMTRKESICMDWEPGGEDRAEQSPEEANRHLQKRSLDYRENIER